ncbi:MAG: tRNA epoxyqueuosine(34) reductase QueG [Marinilabiliaceae bacterium]|nr:tRNA epoxyqueuosine(34) reductase QueG [Marinilabiliaceae bacterium]
MTSTPNLTDAIHRQQIRAKALDLGFDDIGFATAQRLNDDEPRLQKWLLNGANAEMAYMANHFEKRVDPRLLVDGACTIVSLLSSYKPAVESNNPDNFKIARYAWGHDYHEVIREKLNELFNYIRDYHYPDLQGRAFVDSAPVLERAWAARAGLGWMGKNTCLIHPKLGSYVFISELIINMPLTGNSSLVNNHCGSCSRCIDACPTQAITPGFVDARKCISYWTIEHKGEIDPSITQNLNNWIFGCDICQEVCPWNRKTPPSKEPSFSPQPQLLQMNKSDWEELSEDSFRIIFKKSAVKRTKYIGLMRNIRANTNQK